MTINNNIRIIGMIIIIFYVLKNVKYIQGPCLHHCYKKYNILLLICIFLIGYYVCKYKLVII